jgi:hypothetical protein
MRPRWCDCDVNVNGSTCTTIRALRLKAKVGVLGKGGGGGWEARGEARGPGASRKLNAAESSHESGTSP